MDLIIDFYKELDTINLFLFWGIIIVLILLLIFAIILAYKNKQLKRIIISRGIDIDDEKEELAIKTKDVEHEDIAIKTKNIEQEDITIKKENVIIENNIKEENIIVDKEEQVEEKQFLEPPKEEKHFVAEEHVIEYNNDNIVMPTIEEPKKEIKIEIEKPISNAPYQRNVLREMSTKQTTSPIGIVKKDNSEIHRAKELQENLNDDDKINYRTENNTHLYKDNYFEDISKQMSSAIDRTNYELKQEEDAIISYRELMQKKDDIQMVDEEDAVISIEELMKRKREEEKLYGITEDEENDRFISELKHFRSDL